MPQNYKKEKRDKNKFHIVLAEPIIYYKCDYYAINTLY